MLPKKNRVTTKEVEQIFKTGRLVSSPSLTFRFLATNSKETKISVIAPKSIAKIAVKRNLLRRRGYSALKKYILHFPVGVLGVLVYKKFQDDVSIIEHEIQNILSKIN